MTSFFSDFSTFGTIFITSSILRTRSSTFSGFTSYGFSSPSELKCEKALQRKSAQQFSKWHGSRTSPQ
jgi:hypothetical protein